MNRATRVSGALVVLMFSLAAFAGPNPRGVLNATPTTIVCADISDIQAVVLQCPNGSVWYRTYNAADYATVDGGLQADGGATIGGVLVDFKTNCDPAVIPRTSGQVKFCVAANSDAGSVPCFLSTP